MKVWVVLQSCMGLDSLQMVWVFTTKESAEAHIQKRKDDLLEIRNLAKHTMMTFSGMMPPDPGATYKIFETEVLP